METRTVTVNGRIYCIQPIGTSGDGCAGQEVARISRHLDGARWETVGTVCRDRWYGTYEARRGQAARHVAGSLPTFAAAVSLLIPEYVA